MRYRRSILILAFIILNAGFNEDYFFDFERSDNHYILKTIFSEIKFLQVIVM